jgi:predicted N-acetyltransferase YhbS
MALTAPTDTDILNKISIRSEIPEDYDQITIVNDLAFNGKQEGELIIRLRRREQFIPELSLVCESNDIIAGHIFLFPIHIVSGNEKRPTIALGPMSVRPGFQNKGLGGELVKEGLKRAGELGFESVLVMGHPKYYPKFGFRKASWWKIKADFDVPDESLMAIELKKGSLGFGGGIIDYPAEYLDAL